MANEHLKYYIEAIWSGKAATVQAKKDIEGVGDAGVKSTKGTEAFGASLKGLVAGGALLAVGKLALDFGRASVTAFSDAEEAYGKFNVVFGDFARSTENDLDAIAEATGRSKYELIDYASTIQDTFVPLGFAREEAAKMSTSITELAIDLASFNNLETTDVIRDLQSALVGNTETLRAYGVVAQETQIKQEAITLGLWDGKGAIDAQTKAQAILSLTYKGTTDAQGDAIRTADSYANKQRALAAATLDLKVAIGEGLIPALVSLASVATPSVNAVTENITTYNEWVDAIDKGIISQREFQSQFNNNADIFDRNSEAYAYLTKMVRLHEQGMSDADATIVRYYKGMGALADAQEDTADSGDTLTPALQRVREEMLRAAGANVEFKEKTGQSGEELRLLREEADAVAASFESSFTTALGNTSDAYYTNSVNAAALNENLYSQVDAMSENAVVTASAALALGVYDETQIATALNAAIIEEKIKALAQSFVDGEINAGQMKEQMEEIVQRSPYTSEIDVLIDGAISNIDKVRSKLEAMNGLTVTSKVRVVTETSGGAPSGGASSGGSGAGRGDIPDFATGGIVPGPVGMPQLIVAHGGERVSSANSGSGGVRGGGGIVQNFYANTDMAMALALAQAERIRRTRMDAQ